MNTIILPNLIATGIYNSQIAAKNVHISKKRKTTMFEIEIPIEQGGVSYIDESGSKIETNMIICAKPGQTRHTQFPLKCRYLHFIVENGLIYDELFNLPDFIVTEKAGYYIDIFEQIYKYYQSGLENDLLIIHSLILKLVHSLNRETQKQKRNMKINTANTFAVEKAIKYVEKNLSGELNLESVADAVSLSPIYFHNLFKTATGKTLHEYVEEQRIKKAINLLVSTDLSLTSIAYECGFSSQSYFSFVFKRKMDVTPRDYVKSVYKNYDIQPK